MPHSFKFQKQGSEWLVALIFNKEKEQAVHFFEKPESTRIMLNNDCSWKILRANTNSVLAESEDESDLLTATQGLMWAYFVYLTHLKMLEARQPKIGKKVKWFRKDVPAEVFEIAGVWKRPGTERDIYSAEFDYDLTLKDSPELITSDLNWNVHQPEDHVTGWIVCEFCTQFLLAPFGDPPIRYVRDQKKVICGICADRHQEEYGWDENQWL